MASFHSLDYFSVCKSHFQSLKLKKRSSSILWGKKSKIKPQKVYQSVNLDDVTKISPIPEVKIPTIPKLDTRSGHRILPIPGHLRKFCTTPTPYPKKHFIKPPSFLVSCLLLLYQGESVLFLSFPINLLWGLLYGVILWYSLLPPTCQNVFPFRTITHT